MLDCHSECPLEEYFSFLLVYSLAKGRREVDVKLLRIVFLGLLAASAGTAFAQTAAERKACMADYEKYCRSVMPGGGRIIACLKKEREKLSEGCRKVVDAYPD